MYSQSIGDEQQHGNRAADLAFVLANANTVKPVLNGHSKIDKRKVGSLMQILSIAECSPGAFCNAFDLH